MLHGESHWGRLSTRGYHVTRTRKILGVAVCSMLVLAACSRDDEASPADSSAAETTAPADGGGETTVPEGPAAGSFGSLENVCQPGTMTLDSDRGVTATEIQVSVFSDVGYTKKTEFEDMATVFTEWCNSQGGINGRKIVWNLRDAKITEARQRMLEACETDFASVGGGVAFDQAGVADRLSPDCLMPEFPGQVVAQENKGSGLQLATFDQLVNASSYEGYFNWLINEEFPDTKDKVAILVGDFPSTRVIAEQHTEVIAALGGTVALTSPFPIQGAPDWTPYAQQLKDADIKGLIWVGNYPDLPKLLQALTDIGHDLTWVDTNSNVYNRDYLELMKSVTTNTRQIAGLSIYPIEDAASNPATQQLLDLYAEYEPGVTPTLAAVRGFSAFLLFAVAARDCGDELTRRCVYEKALEYGEWDGGGLIAKLDVGSLGVGTETCWLAVEATGDSWTVLDIGAGEDKFLCRTIEHPFTGTYGAPVTLESLGLSIDDLP